MPKKTRNIRHPRLAFDRTFGGEFNELFITK
jgi:hypothetical protein